MDLDRWQTFSLAFQLVTINVDLSRTMHQLEAGRAATANQSLSRAVEYARLTLASKPDRLPANIRESLKAFVASVADQPSIEVPEIRKMQQILEPYNMIVARERGVA